MSSENWIWGYHSVEACLENYPENILELQWIDEGSADKDPNTQNLHALARQGGVRIQGVKKLPKFLDERRTQGVAAKLKDFPEKSLSEVEEQILNVESPGQWALLDGITDPRNFGAILRSAAAFGLKGVFYRDRHSASPNGVVAQASAGNLFRVPLVLCMSFNPLLKILDEAPLRTLALDADGLPIGQVLPSKREGMGVLWMLGSEGDGLRANLREKCKAAAQIPMRPEVESLNVSVAAALAFFVTDQKLNAPSTGN